MLPQFLVNYFLGKFFLPDNINYGTMDLVGIPHENVVFPALDGRKLHGTFIKPDGKAKGTILHCHGNSENITAQYPLVLFLVKGGYNVLVFDYGGYGASEGTPSPQHIIDDSLAALAYLRLRPDVDSRKLALFGQSLGGAAAAGAMEMSPDVACIILEGTFTTYSEMAKETLLGKIFFFLRPFVIPDIGPLHSRKNFNGRPLLIVHGDEDGRVPAKFAPLLHLVDPSTSTLLIIKGFHHLQGSQFAPDYAPTILAFLKKHL